MIKFYYNLAPNPTKVALCLEEMGLPYELVPVDTRKGEQHTPAVPGDQSQRQGAGDRRRRRDHLRQQRHPALSRREDRQVPAGQVGKARGELLSWLMFVASGIGPYSGQAVHFRNFAPEPKDYAVNRYTFEAQRHWGILEERLGKQQIHAGRHLYIVDMAVWGWSRLIPIVLGAGGAPSSCRT